MFNLFLILLSIYLDSLVASIALGGNKIKISFLNILAISIIGSIFLGISLTFGYYINLLIPLQLSQNISVNFSDLSEQIKEELEQNTKIIQIYLRKKQQKIQYL